MTPRPLTSGEVGEVPVEEYGYGLGPPTGILVLRYPPRGVVAEFPDQRDDLVHQLFWSPDGLLAIRRGSTALHVGPGQGLWLRRGVTAQIRALAVQTVLRVCLRRVPEQVRGTSAGVVDVDPGLGAALVSIARPGVQVERALRVRTTLVDALATAPCVAVEHRADDGPAHHVVGALLADPADDTGLEEWAARLHVSPKTLQRDFERTQATSFSAWRTQMRLRAGAGMLGRWSVTETAHRVGYGSASAFVAAFTREFGVTPGRFAAGGDSRRAG